MTAPTTKVTSLFVGESIDGTTYAAVEHAVGGHRRRNSALAETFSRLGPTIAAIQPVTAQAIYTAIELAAGDVVTSVTFTSNTTALATATHQCAALYNGSLAKLAVTNDDTSTAWGASAEKVFTFTAPYTITADGIYYLGLAIVASGTVPTIDGVTGVVTLNARTPAVAFTDTSNVIGAPASFPATATASAGFSGLYAYVK